MRPITNEELSCTISQIATGMSPGPDGLTIEFYKKNWDTIAQQFTEVINEIHLSSHIPKEMKLGSIILIHKKHDAKLLKNYQPISLLNTDLKIYTKLLANRLKPLLPKILHQHQYARPQGRIHQVLTLLRDMFQHSSSRKSNHFYLSLDFETAFDSVDHQLLLKVLTKYGFTQICRHDCDSTYRGHIWNSSQRLSHTDLYDQTRRQTRRSPLSVSLSHSSGTLLNGNSP